MINERKDGTQYVIDQTISPITDGRSTDGYVAINRDVTERKEREQELERFRSAVKHAGHGVLITDVDATIEYANEAFEEITGYAASEVVGETPAMLNSGEHDDAFYEELWETILEGGVWHGEVINQRKDGSHFAVDQTIAPITDRDGDIDGFVAINRDVSQLKAYRAELEAQNERLEQYGETVAHDLRNPLTLLEGDLENLAHVAKTADDDVESATVLEACSNLSETVDRMRELIDDLLTMAEQGQLVLDPEPVSLEATAEDAWRQVDAADASLAIETTVEADPARLRELLSNLFRNAVEHAGADVDVRVGPRASRGLLRRRRRAGNRARRSRNRPRTRLYDRRERHRVRTRDRRPDRQRPRSHCLGHRGIDRRRAVRVPACRRSPTTLSSTREGRFVGDTFPRPGLSYPT